MLNGQIDIAASAQNMGKPFVDKLGSQFAQHMALSAQQRDISLTEYGIAALLLGSALAMRDQLPNVNIPVPSGFEKKFTLGDSSDIGVGAEISLNFSLNATLSLGGGKDDLRFDPAGQVSATTHFSTGDNTERAKWRIQQAAESKLPKRIKTDIEKKSLERIDAEVTDQENNNREKKRQESLLKHEKTTIEWLLKNYNTFKNKAK